MSMPNSPKKLNDIAFKILIVCASTFFLIFEIARAIHVSLTFDEAATYLNYLSSHFLNIFNFSAATNHFLNTLLARFFCLWGGTSEFVLRLPNLLGYALYLLFSFFILSKIANKMIALCGFLLLNLNPYVLDFFSLSRGYGLSLGFFMAALFFYLSFLDKLINNKSDYYQPLSYSLLMAAGSVISNFSLLNFYLSLVFLTFFLFITWNLKKIGWRSSYRPAKKHSVKKNLFLPIFLLLAVIFNILVLAQDLAFSEKLFKPVSIRIFGLNEAEKKEIAIYRIDIKNQETPLIYKDDIWKLNQQVYFCRIKFKFPLDTLRKIRKVELTIGKRIFTYSAREIKRQKSDPLKNFFTFSSTNSVSLKRSAFPFFSPVINWRGDGKFIFYLTLRIILILFIYALIILFLYFFSKFIIRLKLLTMEQFKPLISVSLLLALLISCPIYMLKKNNELYFGGYKDIVQDTFFSLIHSSFYGKFYVSHQAQLVFLLILLSALGFFILLYLNYQKKILPKVLPGLILIMIIFVSSIFIILQRMILKTPYLTGRTAIFYIPLYLLFLVFTFQYLSDVTKITKIISVFLLTILILFSLYHFRQTANIRYTFDWRSDSDTKFIINDLRNMKEQEMSTGPKIALGIDWIFYPSVEYYLKRKNLTSLAVHIVPPYRNNDYYYLEKGFDEKRMILIKRYLTSGSILAKAKKKANSY